MAEEIRPASISRPRRVRPLSRDERDERGENRDRFAHDLAALTHDDTTGKRREAPGAEEHDPESHAHQDPARTPDEEAPPGLGHNLDVTT